MWICLGPRAWTAERAARTARLEEDPRSLRDRWRGHSVPARGPLRGHGDQVLSAASLGKVRPLASLEGNIVDLAWLDQNEGNCPARLRPAAGSSGRMKKKRTSCSCGTPMA